MKYILSIILVLFLGLSVIGDEPAKFKAYINRQPPVKEGQLNTIIVHIPRKYEYKVAAFVRATENDKPFIVRNLPVKTGDNGTFFSFNMNGYKLPFRFFLFKIGENVEDRNVPDGYGVIDKIEFLD